jgi:1-phosphatidylinositol phosphodiesterase
VLPAAIAAAEHRQLAHNVAPLRVKVFLRLRVASFAPALALRSGGQSMLFRPALLLLGSLVLIACETTGPPRGTVGRLSATATPTSWMGALDDSAILAQLSIPGSHESCARIEPFPGTAKCQELALGDQLAAGIRYLDIRCRNVDNRLVIQHNFVYQQMSFDDVLSATFGFLSSNPTETIIMSVREEYAAANSTNTFEQTFDSYTQQNPSGWYLGPTIPTLSEARGKIVLLRRFDAASTPKGIDATAWVDNTTFTIDSGSASLQVEDSYSVSDDNAKWSEITANLAAAQASSPQILFLTNSSGSQSWIFGLPNIPSVSSTINPELSNYFSSNTSGRFGIVAMDFVDSNRSALILSTNFNSNGPVSNGIYKVINYNSGKVLDVSSVSTADGAAIHQWTYVGQHNQHWMITNQGGGWYQVAAVHSGKALDDPGSSTLYGAQMDQRSCNGGADQRWQIVANGDGTYRLANQQSGLVLDVAGSSLDDGAAVIQWGWAGSNNQRWLIQSP